VADFDGLRVVILAAGLGRRLGRDKATLPWGASTLLEHVLRQFPPERLAARVVVANLANQAAVAALVGAADKVVVNPDPGSDMLASVRLGVAALPPGPGPVCVHPVDVFAVSGELVSLLHEAWRADRERIHLPEVAARGAHPVLIPASLLAAIEAIPAGRGLDYLLEAFADRVVRHRWYDRRLLVDLDTPEEYAQHRPAGG